MPLRATSISVLAGSMIIAASIAAPASPHAPLKPSVTAPGRAKTRPTAKAASRVQLQAVQNKKLFQAVSSGDLVVMKLAIKNGANVNCRDGQGMTSAGFSEVPAGKTPLIVAIEKKSLAAVQLLIAHKADVDALIDPDELIGIDDYMAYSPGMPMNALNYATRLNQPQIVSALIRAGVELPKPTDSDPLMNFAAEKNSVEAARVLLDAGVSPDLSTEYNSLTPLEFAADRGNLDMVKLLLSKGAKINAEQRGEPALIKAIDNRNFDVAIALIEAGANANSVDQDGQTALIRICQTVLPGDSYIPAVTPAMTVAQKNEIARLSQALKQERIDLIAALKALISHGADPNRFTADSYLPLLVLLEHGDPSMVRALLEAGADPSLSQKPFPSPLRMLCQHGNASSLRLYLRDNTDGTLSIAERTKILKKAEEQDVIVLKMMLAKGVNVKSPENIYAVGDAARNGNSALVRALLANGGSADIPQPREPYVMMPLDRLVRRLSPQQATATEREYNAYVNRSMGQMPGGRGPYSAQGPAPASYTPLMMAVSAGYPEIADDLLARGANAKRRDALGRSPLHFLATGGRTATIYPFEKSYASISRGARNMSLLAYDIASPLPAKQTTSLITWAAAGDSKIAGALIAHGSPVDLADTSKRTPLYMAAIYGAPAVVNTLLKHGASVQRATLDMPLLTKVVTGGRRQRRTLPNLTILQLVLAQVEEVEGNLPSKGKAMDAEERQEKALMSKIRAEMFRQRRYFLHTWGWQDAQVISSLAKKGVNLEAKDKNGLTPLMQAARLGHIEAARALLAAGSDPNARDGQGMTVLMQVISHGLRTGKLQSPRNSILQPLKTVRGTKPVVPVTPPVPESRKSSLRKVWGQEDAEMIGLLTRHGAKTNIKDSRGRTALTLARQLSHQEALAYLTRK